MKKTALASCRLLLLSVSMFKFSLAKANPVPYPTEPNQELPALKVESPNNGEVFKTNNISVKFSVTIPDSWNHYWMFGFPVIGDYGFDVLLDGHLEYAGYESGSQDVFIRNYSVVLDELARGKHSAKILITARTFYQNPYSPGRYYEYLRNMSVTRNFTVLYSQPSPSSAPTPSPTATPSPVLQQTEPFPTTSVIASIGSVAIVGLSLLIYLKKRQKGSVDKGVKLES
jgi:hypothetical protein